MIRYNKEGDLLFSVSKDQLPTVWDSETGTRLGTYEGHTGAIWACDVNNSSTLFATAGADQMCKIWDVEKGDCLGDIVQQTPVRGCGWSHGDNMLLTITDKSFGKTPSIQIYNMPGELDNYRQHRPQFNPCVTYETPEKINHALWGPNNETIYFCSEDGSVAVLDVETGKEKCFEMAHTDGMEVKRLCWDSDYSMIASCSLDHTAKLLDARNVNVVTTFQNDFPVNDVAVVPSDVMNHVIVGGGIDAQSVTNVGGARNKFEIKFMHKIFGEELGSTAGHFGPVNCLAAEPNGRGFASGGEDGFVRLHHFDADYYNSPGRPDEFA